MAVVTIPADLLGLIARQTFGQMNFDMEFASEMTGASQVRLFAPPRWTCALVGEQDLLPEQAAAWRAFILSLQGKVNQLAVYDILNGAPAGTYRGSPLLSVALAVGDRTLTIADATQAGETWKKGDLVGAGSGATRQLFMVMADAFADVNGEVELDIYPPARYAQALGSAAIWDKPTCLMRRRTADTAWEVDGYMSGGFSLDLMESWE